MGKGAVLRMGLGSLLPAVGHREFAGLRLRAPGSARGTCWECLFLQPPSKEGGRSHLREKLENFSPREAGYCGKRFQMCRSKGKKLV